MVTMPFNLIDEQWIHVRWLDGHLSCVSLEELFAEAPKIQGIAGEMPTQAFAILRVLLSFGVFGCCFCCLLRVLVGFCSVCRVVRGI